MKYKYPMIIQLSPVFLNTKQTRIMQNMIPKQQD